MLVARMFSFCKKLILRDAVYGQQTEGRHQHGLRIYSLLNPVLEWCIWSMECGMWSVECGVSVGGVGSG